MTIFRKNIKKILLTAIFAVYLFSPGCVENLVNSQSSKPSITIESPASGDTVQVGENTISYNASDYSGGSGLAYYEVFVNDEFQKKFLQNSDGTNPDLYFTVDSTLLFSEVSFYVIVYNQDGNLKVSDVVENLYVKETVTPPKAPGNLFLVRLNDYSVNLVWDDSSDNERKFELWRKDGVNGPYKVIRELPPNTISTDDYGLSPVVDYYYKVRAVNEYGSSAYSNEASTFGSAGGSPFNLQAQAKGSSRVILTWTDVAVNELGFKIQRQDPFSGDWKHLAIAVRNSNTYEDNTAQPVTTYSYRIAYYTNSSQSAWSNVATVTTYSTDVPPPANLEAQYQKDIGKVLVTWDDNTYLENGTYIERKLGVNGQYSEIGSTDVNVHQFKDSTAVFGNIYYYRARYYTTEQYFTDYSNVDSAYVGN